MENIEKMIFVSETKIPQIIEYTSDLEIILEKINSYEIISYEYFLMIINFLKINIKKSSNKILKRAKSRLELVRNKRNYINLDKKEGYVSALVSGLFRDPNISKNSNDLCLIELQRKVLENLHTETFDLFINWGRQKDPAVS